MEIRVANFPHPHQPPMFNGLQTANDSGCLSAHFFKEEVINKGCQYFFLTRLLCLYWGCQLLQAATSLPVTISSLGKGSCRFMCLAIIQADFCTVYECERSRSMVARWLLFLFRSIVIPNLRGCTRKRGFSACTHTEPHS